MLGEFSPRRQFWQRRQINITTMINKIKSIITGAIHNLNHGGSFGKINAASSSLTSYRVKYLICLISLFMNNHHIFLPISWVSFSEMRTNDNTLTVSLSISLWYHVFLSKRLFLVFSYILYRTLDICYLWTLLKLENDRVTHKNKTLKKYPLVIQNVIIFLNLVRQKFR